eukprot:3419448-Rhodomonas_salina.2
MEEEEGSNKTVAMIHVTMAVQREELAAGAGAGAGNMRSEGREERGKEMGRLVRAMVDRHKQEGSPFGELPVEEVEEGQAMSGTRVCYGVSSTEKGCAFVLRGGILLPGEHIPTDERAAPGTCLRACCSAKSNTSSPLFSTLCARNAIDFALSVLRSTETVVWRHQALWAARQVEGLVGGAGGGIRAFPLSSYAMSGAHVDNVRYKLRL